MTNQEALTLLNTFIEDNNLILAFSPFKIHSLTDGGFVVEKPELVVSVRQEQSVQKEVIDATVIPQESPTEK